MNDQAWWFRSLGREDLEAVNAVIRDAVMSWNLAERVKRLSLTTYQYDEQDLAHFEMVGLFHDDQLLGLAAWEPAEPDPALPGKQALLLHGLFVSPAMHGKGCGSALLKRVVATASSGGFDGVLVKAVSVSKGFFAAQGMQRLPVLDEVDDYPHRYWRPIG